MQDYSRGYMDGENVRTAYDSRGDEYTVPEPELRGESAAYQKVGGMDSTSWSHTRRVHRPNGWTRN